MKADCAQKPGLDFVTFSSRDPEEASEKVHRAYEGAARAEAIAPKAEFMMRMAVAKIGALTLSRVEMRNWAMTRETRDAVIVVIPEAGALTMRSGAHVGVHRPDKAFGVGRPFESHLLTVDRGAGMALTAPLEGLRARIERVTGQNFDTEKLSHMVDQIDATAPISQALARSAKAAMAEVGGLQRLGLGGFAASGYEELLFNLMAAALLPEIAQPKASAADCGSATVRRAREFIREHASETIEISRLAADLGVSMRALQQNFQRAFGFSPRDYIVECRLDLARNALQANYRSQTVAEIAFASGFGDLSHFGAKYRDKYGERPSATLRNAAI